MANYIRFNPVTNDYDYYFPMEVRDPADKELARFCGFEIGMARVGYRKFLAVYVPCKRHIIGRDGREQFIDTPGDVQHARYLAYASDELREQDAAKQDGRCQIPDGKGGVMRCPCRVDNPDYVPGGSQPKTLPIRCEGCKYEAYRQAHTSVPLSDLDHENEFGEMESYDIPSPKGYLDGYDYEELSALFVDYVRREEPRLADLAEMLTQEYTRSEAARKLNIPLNTAWSRREKLKELCRSFLDNLVRLS